MITIRKATLDDVNLLYTFGEDVAEFVVNDTTVNFWPVDILARAVESENVIILIARDSSKFAGFIIVNYNQGLRKAIIENLYVASTIREKGVAGKLLNQSLRMLAERGCEYVATLIPTDARKALSLYQDVGFTKGETFLWLDMPLVSNFVSPKPG